MCKYNKEREREREKEREKEREETYGRENIAEDKFHTNVVC